MVLIFSVHVGLALAQMARDPLYLGCKQAVEFNLPGARLMATVRQADAVDVWTLAFHHGKKCQGEVGIKKGTDDGEPAWLLGCLGTQMEGTEWLLVPDGPVRGDGLCLAGADPCPVSIPFHFRPSHLLMAECGGPDWAVVSRGAFMDQSHAVDGLHCAEGITRGTAGDACLKPRYADSPSPVVASCVSVYDLPEYSDVGPSKSIWAAVLDSRSSGEWVFCDKPASLAVSASYNKPGEYIMACTNFQIPPVQVYAAKPAIPPVQVFGGFPRVLREIECSGTCPVNAKYFVDADVFTDAGCEGPDWSFIDNEAIWNSHSGHHNMVRSGQYSHHEYFYHEYFYHKYFYHKYFYHKYFYHKYFYHKYFYHKYFYHNYFYHKYFYHKYFYHKYFYHKYFYYPVSVLHFGGADADQQRHPLAPFIFVVAAIIYVCLERSDVGSDVGSAVPSVLLDDAFNPEGIETQHFEGLSQIQMPSANNPDDPFDPGKMIYDPAAVNLLIRDPFLPPEM
ncbi:MAG: uncharacterized protein KVP18_000242 [Porospora cf. gigantea A]|uniref:uncharacterized protein n=1 Tax=Porospora cf. gigantea A TaxID=2853593 RepID=UPI00355A66CB|nr:MAG: hypothetical protein KVP18_000242 [Porospora cf. gigantea A]